MEACHSRSIELRLGSHIDVEPLDVGSKSSSDALKLTGVSNMAVGAWLVAAESSG